MKEEVERAKYSELIICPYLSALWRENEHGDPLFLIRF